MVTTTVTVVSGHALAESLAVCAGTTVTYPDGTTALITADAVQVSLLTTAAGCDSVVTTTVTLLPAYMQQRNEGVCIGTDLLLPDGTVLTVVADAVHTSYLTTAAGCDSLVQTDITALGASVGRVNERLCAGLAYTLPDGTVLDPVTSDTLLTTVLTNAQGCDSVVQTILVVQTDPLLPVMRHVPELPDQDHSTVVFSTLETGTLQWTVADLNGLLLMAGTGSATTYTFPSDSIFAHVVCLEVLREGCSGSICDTITLLAEPTVYIPNTFTPLGPGAGDGLNDVFLPVIGGGVAYRYVLEVYDRWGQQLFATSDPGLGWDGLFKGQLVPLGVYAYRLQFSMIPLTFVHRYAGHVNVLR